MAAIKVTKLKVEDMAEFIKKISMSHIEIDAVGKDNQKRGTIRDRLPKEQIANQKLMEELKTKLKSDPKNCHVTKAQSSGISSSAPLQSTMRQYQAHSPPGPPHREPTTLPRRQAQSPPPVSRKVRWPPPTPCGSPPPPSLPESSKISVERQEGIVTLVKDNQRRAQRSGISPPPPAPSILTQHQAPSPPGPAHRKPATLPRRRAQSSPPASRKVQWPPPTPCGSPPPPSLPESCKISVESPGGIDTLVKDNQRRGSQRSGIVPPPPAPSIMTQHQAPSPLDPAHRKPATLPRRRAQSPPPVSRKVQWPPPTPCGSSPPPSLPESSKISVERKEGIGTLVKDNQRRGTIGGSQRSGIGFPPPAPSIMTQHQAPSPPGPACQEPATLPDRQGDKGPAPLGPTVLESTVLDTTPGNKHMIIPVTYTDSITPISTDSSDSGLMVVHNERYCESEFGRPSTSNSEEIQQHILVAASLSSSKLEITSKNLTHLSKQRSVLGSTENIAASETRSPKNYVTVLDSDGNFSKNYTVMEKLGEGAYGKVLHCIDNDTAEEFAVKIGKYQISESERRSFRNEISVLKRLDHPNIVQYYGSNVEVGCINIFMELVSGGSVRALIEKIGPLNNKLSTKFLRQILDGLSYLHGQNVIHRDLKAANILKSFDARLVKIADFGLAKIVESLKSVFETGKLRGTVFWMAPEMISEEEFSDRVDIWGVGVTAFEFLQGNPPYRNLDRRGAMYNIEMGRTWSKCEEKFPSTVSDDLKDFIRKCVQQNPKDRPSAEQLLEHQLFS